MYNYALSLLQDPRMIQVMGVLMGIDLQAFERPEGSNEMPPGFKASGKEEYDEDEEIPPLKPHRSEEEEITRDPSQASSSQPKAAPAPPKAEVVDEAMDVDPPLPVVEDEDAKVKKSALAEKELGSAAYKKRNFDEAGTHFQKAWDLYPKDITFLTNLAGM